MRLEKRLEPWITIVVIFFKFFFVDIGVLNNLVS